MLFRLHPLRFSFIAREPIHFAVGSSANILRGAFGTILRRLACTPECNHTATCPRRATCPYARLFRPSAITQGPSGLADWPRPFVFRAAHLDGRTFATGLAFHFDLNLFDTETAALRYVVLTFAQLAQEGLGPERRKVEFLQVEQLNESEGASAIEAQQNVAPIEFDLAAAPIEVTRLRIRFLTPTELKSGNGLAPSPEFPILAARIRDRISKLRELYGDGPLPIDFHAFGQRASHISMTRCEITHVDLRRRSSRTGQIHGIGGFIGEAEYEGSLTEFVPFLHLAQWTGVGRQTVWGKGAIMLLSPQSQNPHPG